jgi:hypothetical protein
MLEISVEAAKETTRMALVSVPKTPLPQLPKATTNKKKGDVGPNGHPLHNTCGKYHHGGDDRCFKLHPELLRMKLRKNSREDNKTNNKPTELKAPTGSPRVFQFQSGLAGINMYRGMLGLYTDAKSLATTSPDEIPDDCKGSERSAHSIG